MKGKLIKLRVGVILSTLLVLCILSSFMLPVAYAETPLSIAVVVADQATTGLGSPFQHHSFIDDGIMFVIYQAAATNQVVYSWSDDGTTWVAGDVLGDCNASTAETVGGQFDTWFNPDDDTLRVVVVNESTNNSIIKYCSFAVNTSAHTLTNESVWRTAVEGVGNVSYRNPTICVTNNESVFITYGYVINASSDVYVMTTNDTTDDIWIPEVGFPMFNLSGTGNNSKYGSVIPLYTSTDNVSVQYATDNGSVYVLEQTAIYWSGGKWTQGANYATDTSGWYLPTGQEWDYNAVSIPTAVNVNDVALQCIQTDGADYRVFFNRRANESDAWGSSGLYARNFGEGGWAYNYVGAMGIRNAIFALVYSGWDMAGGSTDIYSNDWTNITGDWAGIASVATDTGIPYVSTMSDYQPDPSATGYIGFIYGNQDDDIMYGLYGPAAPTPTPAPSTVPAVVTMMSWIVVLVFGGLICLVLIAYGTYETVRGRGKTELVKIGVAGLITLIIVSIIVDNLL